MSAHRLAALALGFAIAACDGGFARSPDQIDHPRILAIAAEPPEVAPGDAVVLRALVASPGDAAAGAILDWARCDAPRPVAAVTPVAQACLDDSDAVAELGRRAATAGVAFEVPADACATFGSEPPPPALDQPPRRPVDPDLTGGYYQPVRAGLDDSAIAIGFVRLRCALAGAPAELARRHAEDYGANQNPSIVAAEPGDGIVVATDEQVALRLRVTPAERFLYFDARAVTLTERREQLTVAWFADAGELDPAVTVLPTEGTEAGATWRAPSTPGPVHLWAVVRDDRGGAAWHRVGIDVR